MRARPSSSRTSRRSPTRGECRIESFKEADEIIRLRAIIYVAHDSQKGIVIGKGGQALKKGGHARARGWRTFSRSLDA